MELQGMVEGFAGRRNSEKYSLSRMKFFDTCSFSHLNSLFLGKTGAKTAYFGIEMPSV
jgi:hypothetical protein